MININLDQLSNRKGLTAQKIREVYDLLGKSTTGVSEEVKKVLDRGTCLAHHSYILTEYGLQKDTIANKDFIKRNAITAEEIRKRCDLIWQESNKENKV